MSTNIAPSSTTPYARLTRTFPKRGDDQADFQAKMNATAFNIKRWMSLLDPVAIT
ncbi:MAG: hypothetical protein H8E47_05365 [Anaerolineales bacterium]|nr:hypothetical protein [Anaerolineales bacterium]